MIDTFKSCETLHNDSILHKGFGLIYKFVMQDPDLSLEAKAINAYLSSFAGNKDSAFPSRSKILKDLDLSKDGFYPHLNQLVEQGYIKIEKKLFRHNTYYFVNCPEKLKQKGEFSHLKECGYGIIPKAVMQDPALDIKAKGIYALLASYAGNTRVAFPSQETILHHLNISENTYQKYLKQLIDLKYVWVEQQRMSGKYDVNRYVLLQYPDSPEYMENDFPVFPKETITHPKKPYTSKTPRPLLKKTTSNINLRNKNSSNINTSISSTRSASVSKPIRTSVDDEISALKNILNYQQQILLYPDNKDDIDKSIRFCAEFLANNKNSFNIGASFFQKDSFRQTLLNISFSAITAVLDRIRTTGIKINNTKNYIVASIYNQILNSNNSHKHSYQGDSVRVEFKTFDLDEFFAKSVASGMKYEGNPQFEPSEAL